MKTKTFRDAYKTFENRKTISYIQYKTVLENFSLFVVEEVFKNNIVKFPEKFGTLQVVGKEIKPRIDKETGEIAKGLAPDWASTRKLWKENSEAKREKTVIYFLNEHTQRVRFRVRWSKKYIFTENKEFYTFRLSRKNKRILKSLIKNKKEFQILN